MYRRMAVSTSGIEFPSGGYSRRSMRCGRDMALQAQERHCHLQHIIIHGPMRTMAVDAVLVIFRVLINEWTFLVGMALGADLLNRCLSEQIVIQGPVGLMTAGAEDLFFVHWVVARQCEFCPDFLVAAFTHILHVRTPNRQIRSRVDIVALEAGHIRNSMRSCIPVVKIKTR